MDSRRVAAQSQRVTVRTHQAARIASDASGLMLKQAGAKNAADEHLGGQTNKGCVWCFDLVIFGSVGSNFRRRPAQALS